MRRNPNIVVLGEGIAERGGCFGHTKELWKEFGAKRVIDTPICELAFTGASAGASATGCRAVADLMFADFLFDAGTQIVQMAAKLRYMSDGQTSVPMVIRAPMGMIKNAGAHHSGAYYPMWGHVPGLIVVTPSDPAEAKGLMRTALRAGDPVVFLEHKGLFSMKAPVPTGEYLIPFGKARVVRQGSDLTLVSCGQLLHRCLQAAEALQEKRISCEVIDLRTIVPLDVETLALSVRTTGKLLVVDEAWSMFGVGAEIAAAMNEYAFDCLDAPVARLHTARVSFPFSPTLDEHVAVTVPKIVAAAHDLMMGRVRRPVHPRADGGAPEPDWAALPPPTRIAPRIAPPADTTSRREPLPAAPVAATPSPSPLPPPPRPAPVAPPVAQPVAAVRPAPAKGEVVVSGNGEVLVKMPNMDLTVEEAKVVQWVKKIGDRVTKGESVLEVETDKAVVEIEAPASGTLARIVAQPDEVVALGATLGVIKT
jgi:2-oxoisovalerate dehydrogenase E1 component